MARKAVVLFNLGGPDNLEAVEPFLFNLFYDPAIIRVPKPIRYLIAKLISKRRAPIAQDIYRNIGGSSPLLQQTRDQATALQTRLTDLLKSDEVKVFIAMRYWHPMTEQTVRDVKAFGADEVILLPLYPQFSTTTTGSSVKEWKKVAKQVGLDAVTTELCCYPDDKGFIDANTALILEKLQQIPENKDRPRLLFSAHGLPKKIVDAGDPYQWQVEQSVAAIVKKLNIPDLDYTICYQSRVGPVEWIKPATEDEIERAGKENRSLMIIPVAFVSEHSETLVELDIEYAELAEQSGVPDYYRVPTVGVHADYINGLADLVLGMERGKMTSLCGQAICPKSMADCPFAKVD
ncbi:ferrochelatase [Sneathiella aquimaris]|uniref:ferrochelatase n=1 Tax=Sneathiella aquimaris TaxID=2599305 RepID=UPI00146E56E0|nr:ferrochelatase [Sneathiella aquimaris]